MDEITSTSTLPPLPPIKISKMALMKAIIESAPRTKPDPKMAPAEWKPKTTKPNLDTARAEPKEKVTLKDQPSEEIKEKVVQPQPKEDIFTSIKNIEGIHIDIYEYFDISPSLATHKDIERLKDIHEWVFEKTKDSKQALRKIEDIEIMLGRSELGESRLNKIWNHIRIRKII